MCTLETHGNIFILTLIGTTSEHRLSLTLISEIRTLLGIVRSKSKPGSVLITTAQGKFFSNGFDLGWAQSKGPTQFRDRLYHLLQQFKPLIADLISLPLPTIAAVTGHAAAAGFLLAICHDFVLMRKDRGFLYMSEIDIAITVPGYFMDLLKLKIGSPRNLRDVALHGVKIKAEVGVEMGIVDSAYDSAEETVEAAFSLGEKLRLKNWYGEVYGEIRKGTLKDALPNLGLVEKEIVTAKL
ncbi:Enoyl-coa delta isomerase [Thalictrum thalictroides]|uniref:Delta(3)-Delta(2)-enoyl-CoA isomerase n=1 Tax=Thalictrum thalictroides TaxID=46969 RepID=A0A7J6XED9_THATH|nr:Enoyl-coa delta isomerase [Thalictrum thalictroides]